MTKTEDYTLPLKCLNCNNQWVETIPFGEDFKEGTFGHAGYGFGAKAVFVKCPRCGSGKIIKKLEVNGKVLDLEKEFGGK